MRRGWILLLLGALVGLGTHELANAEDSPSLDGVWLIQRAPRELRTIDGKEPPLLPQALAHSTTRSERCAEKAIRRSTPQPGAPRRVCRG